MGINYNKLLGKEVPKVKDNKNVNTTTAASLVTKGLGQSYLPTNIELNSGQSIRFGDSKFDSGIENAELFGNISKIRAERQPWTHQATNSLFGGIGAGILTAGESLSLLLDIPSNIAAMKGYVSNEENLDAIEGNVFADFFSDTKQSLLNEHMPIYKKNPDKVIDFSDSAFYWESFRGIVDSGLGFGLSGMGVGAGVKLAGKALRLARIGNYTKNLNKGINAVSKSLQEGRAGQITAGYLTNHAENKMMALELYESSQEQLYSEFVEQFKEANPGEEPDENLLKEFRLDAKINAGKQANNFLLQGKMFAITDILQLNRMFKGVGKAASRSPIDNPSIKNFLKSQFKPSMMAKEAGEEIGQNTLQKELEYEARKEISKKYDLPKSDLEDMTFVERLATFATSEQALLEGAMGALGGPIQYAVTQAPFENRGARKERFTSQDVQRKQNKEWTTKVLFNEWVKELNKAQAATALPGDSNGVAIDEQFNEVQNDTTFIRQATDNFAKGTTDNFEQHINDLLEDKDLSEPQRKYIQKKKDLLNELEEDYNNNSRRYSMGAELTHSKYAKKLQDRTIRLIEAAKDNITETTRSIVNDLNRIHKTDYTVDMALNNTDLKESFSNAFSEFSTVKDALREKDVLIDMFSKESLKHTEAIEAYKADDALFEEYINIARNTNTLTEDKIKGLEELKQFANKKFTKEQLTRDINALKNNLKETRNNEEIDKVGGSDKVRADAKQGNKHVDSKIEEKALEYDTNQLNQEEVEEKLGKITADDLDRLMASAQVGEDPLVKVKEYLLNKLEEGELEPEGTDYANKIIDKISNILKDVDQLADEQADGVIDVPQINDEKFEEGVDKSPPTPDQVVPVKPKKDAKQSESTNISNEVIRTSKAGNKSSVSGVKVNYFKGTDTYNKYLKSNSDKKGDPIEFIANETFLNQTQNSKIKKLYDSYKGNADKFLSDNPLDLIDNFPIDSIFNNDKNNRVTMFTVKPKDGEQAYIKERALRKQIIYNLLKGEKATSTVKYQYSGGFTSDGSNKSVYNIQGLNTIEEVPQLLVTDANGKLRYTDGEIYPGASAVVLNEQKEPYRGQIFVPIQSSNGEVPLKLNIASLSNNEKEAIRLLFRWILNPANNQKGSNALFTKITDKQLEPVYNLISSSDRDYLGDASVSDLLNHLVHEGIGTKKGKDATKTQMYFEKGRLYYGLGTDGTPYSVGYEELGSVATRINLYEFLDKFKNRSVNIKKLENDSAYKKLMFDTQILSTDVELDANGNPFQSINVGGNELLRYQTKAIYSEGELNNKVSSEVDVFNEQFGNPPSDIIVEEDVAKSEKTSNLAQNKVKEEVKKLNIIGKKDTKITRDNVEKLNDQLNNKLSTIKENMEKINKKGKC